MVGLEQGYLASVLPITATLPVTYVWQASGQETLTRTGGLTDTVTYTWQVPGEQVIELLALNAMGAVTTTFHTVVLTPELSVVITGTSSGYSGLEYFLTAQVSPLTATQPLTYVWTITRCRLGDPHRRADRYAGVHPGCPRHVSDHPAGEQCLCVGLSYLGGRRRRAFVHPAGRQIRFSGCTGTGFGHCA